MNRVSVTALIDIECCGARGANQESGVGFPIKNMALPKNANLPRWVGGKLCGSRVRQPSEDGANRGSTPIEREFDETYPPPAQNQAGKKTKLQGESKS